MSAADYNGKPLAEGDHVTAWLDGIRYTATVKTVKVLMASDWGIHRIVLARDDKGTERECRADAVVVLDPDTTTPKENDR